MAGRFISILSLGLVCLILCQSCSAWLEEWSLVDDFNGTSINSSIWSADLYPGNAARIHGGELVLNSMPGTFAHLELNNSWDNFELLARFKVEDNDSGTGRWAPGIFFYWGPGNWSSLQVDAAEGKIRSYSSVNGRIVENESLSGVIFDEYYYLDMQLYREDAKEHRYVRKRASLKERESYYDNVSFDSTCRHFQGIPKLIMLGMGYDTGSVEYPGPDLDAGSPTTGGNSSVYIDDFRIRFGPAWYGDTAKYLSGKVHITVLFVSRYNVTYPEEVKSSVMSKTILAGQFLSELAPPSANVSFSYSSYDSSIANESVLLCEDDCLDEKPDWCGEWMNEASKNAGFFDPDNDSYYPDDIGLQEKDENGADQSVVLYSVYSENRYPTCFPSAYASHDNWAVITEYGLRLDPYYEYTYPHEILHTFDANDEYDPDRCYSCDHAFGDFYYANGNCISCNNSIPCIMRGNYKSMCNYTRGQIGWGDHDGDGILDPFDHEMFSPANPEMNTTTTSTTTTTYTCPATSLINLSAGENDILFETPHKYPANMDCRSDIYVCPEGYYGSIHVKYETEGKYDVLYVYNDYLGTYSRYSGNSSYAWIPVPNQNRSTPEYVNTTHARMRFLSDEALSFWGVKADKINCTKENPGASRICSSWWDQIPCDKLELTDILYAINQWYTGQADLDDVLIIIDLWRIA